MALILSFSFTSESKSRVAPKTTTHGASIFKLFIASLMSIDSPYINNNSYCNS